MDSTNSQFNITATNNTSNAGSFVIYQRSTNRQLEVNSLAWRTQQTMPRNQARFSWDLSYAFVAGQAGVLRPGSIFNVSDDYPASLTNNNAITFTNNGFVNQTTKSPSGSLYIQDDNSVGIGNYSVGIALSSSPIFAVQAIPNTQIQFDPNQEYWIAFGNYQPGMVLDSNIVYKSVQLQFQGGQNSLNVTLNPDGSWSVNR